MTLQMNIWANNQVTPLRFNGPFHDTGIIIGSQRSTRLNEGKNFNFLTFSCQIFSSSGYIQCHSISQDSDFSKPLPSLKKKLVNRKKDPGILNLITTHAYNW